MITMILLLIIALFTTPTFLDIQKSLNTESATSEVYGAGLGRKKKNCRGRGICIVKPNFKGFEIDDTHTMIRMNFDSDHMVRSIVFLEDHLTKGAIKRFFEDDIFIMEEEYFDQLKTRDGVLTIDIPKGRYKLQRTREGFLLEI